jgi:hypothetical protein
MGIRYFERFSHRAGQLAPAAVFDDFHRVVKPVNRLFFGIVRPSRFSGFEDSAGPG